MSERDNKALIEALQKIEHLGCYEDAHIARAALTQADRLLTPATVNDDGLRQMERAYSMLQIEGVSRERARSVANGISVLATRWRREVASLEQALGALTKQVRDLATAAAGCGCTEGVAEKSRAILAEIGEMP